VIVAFIDAYKHVFGVEPICRVLQEQDLPIAASTYYAFKSRPRAARSISDERLQSILQGVHRENYGVYGVRKMWHALHRLGEQVGRDQVARLMRAAGLRGVSRLKRRRRVPEDASSVRAGDLVRREWFRDAPDAVWVCDFTFVQTREGWMYVSFVQDGFSRRILGFSVRSTKSVELVTRSLLQAVNERERRNVGFVADGVIVHSDAGSQYTSLAFTDVLLDLGLSASVGRVGTAYDNALIESTIGLFKTELVNRKGIGWDSRRQLEEATVRWVAWFNRDRLHSELGYRSPIEIEQEYAKKRSRQEAAA
jgi:putative transposase